jgi:predicted NBD/HSP70 family sugar kinase
VYVQPADLRLGNARRVLAALQRAWPCTRPELARRTGLSTMTVGKVAEQLLELGLLDEAPGEPLPGLGRPPRQLSPSARLRFVAIELGVHTSTVCRLGLAGEAVPPRRVSIAMPGSAAEFLTSVGAARAALGPEPVEAVLISVPGVLDSGGPSIVYSPNLHWSEGPGLLRALGVAFGAPVCAVQEAQALALGHLAAGTAPEHFLMVDFGDGVGSSVVTSGKLLGGPLPLSGELGHTPVPGNRRRCGCGAIGCIETLAGRAGLLASHREVVGREVDWAQLRASLHERELPEWLLTTLDALAMVLAGALNLLGLREVVVVGDGAELHPAIVPQLRERLMAHSLLGRFGEIECRLAPARRQLGLLAAAVDRRLLPEPGRVAR